MILPNDAINKAYEELLEKDKEKAFVSLETWRAQKHNWKKEGGCAVCEDNYIRDKGGCYCSALGQHAPCGFCTGDFLQNCECTNGEVSDLVEFKKLQSE